MASKRTQSSKYHERTTALVKELISIYCPIRKRNVVKPVWIVDKSK